MAAILLATCLWGYLHADDIAILSPTRNGLHKLLNIKEELSLTYIMTKKQGAQKHWKALNRQRQLDRNLHCITSLMATMVRHVERKALQIHNLTIKGTQNLLRNLCAVVSLHGDIGRPPLWKTGDTHSYYCGRLVLSYCSSIGAGDIT
jgi:hypothetical protein